MKVTSFKFSFQHVRRTFEASCDSYQVKGFHHYPVFRVVVPKEKGGEDIFIFYHINTEKQKFFWYDLPDHRQLIAQSIVKTLDSIIEK